VKGGNEDLARDFRERAYLEAKTIIQMKRKQRSYHYLMFYKLDLSFSEDTINAHIHALAFGVCMSNLQGWCFALKFL
jgi:hypothetical protein